MNGARVWAYATSASAPWLRPMRWLAISTACCVLLACASARRIDSEVRSFGATPALDSTKLAYRFERLPSQQGPEGLAQDRLEAMAAVPLAQRGLVADVQNAALTVHLSARVEAVDRSAPFGVPGMLRKPGLWAGAVLGCAPNWAAGWATGAGLRAGLGREGTSPKVSLLPAPFCVSPASRLLPCVCAAHP